MFERQLPLVGAKGQERLASSGVLIAGVGGLGTVVAESLVRAGVGRLWLVDNDRVSEPDLNRQILYKRQDIGQKKVDVAVKRLKAIGADADVVGLGCEITPQFRLPKGASVAADCLDNYRSRFLLDEICLRQGVLLVHGGISGRYGQICSILPESKRRLTDLYRGVDSQEGSVEVLGACCMVVGAIQALEIIDFLLKGIEGLSFSDALLAIDLNEYSLERIELA